MARIIFSPPGVPPVKRATYEAAGFKFNDRAFIIRMGHHAKRTRWLMNPMGFLFSLVLNGLLASLSGYLLIFR